LVAPCRLPEGRALKRREDRNPKLADDLHFLWIPLGGQRPL